MQYTHIHTLLWITDLHLNFVDQSERDSFYKTLNELNSDAVLITGDIAEGSVVCDVLTQMADILQKPLFFVLGNHDYYGCMVGDVKQQVNNVCKQNQYLCWLSQPTVISLAHDTILVGIDAWADGRFGDFQHSQLELVDAENINDFTQAYALGRSTLLQTMQQFADQDAETLKQVLTEVVSHHPRQVLIATHVPPFAEVAWHSGMLCDNDRLPFFTSNVTGDVIRQCAKTHDNIEFSVYSGHTHVKYSSKIDVNLMSHVGEAAKNRGDQWYNIINVG